jgi:hypothetical protein
MLALNPTDRVRLDLPPPKKEEPSDEWASLRRFPVIDGGKDNRRR